jgi:hypothetical protein
MNKLNFHWNILLKLNFGLHFLSIYLVLFFIDECMLNRFLMTL